MPRHKIAVVGAGMAGLVAAYELAQKGALVTVFEKDHGAGGRAKTIYKDGFELNLGPHALYMGGEAYRFLAANNLVPQGAAPQYGKPAALFGGAVRELPISLPSIIFSDYLGWRDRLEVASFFRNVTRIDYASLMSVTLADWLTANITGATARATIAAYARLATYSNSAGIISAGAALRQLAMALQGVLYLDHGWNTMIESLKNALAGNAQFEYSSGVQSVRELGRGTIYSADRAGQVEVVSGARTHTFDAIILCVPPSEVSKLVPDAISESTMKQIVPSYAACLDVCLRKLPNPDRGFGLGIDEPLYFSVHSNAAKLAPAGGAMVHAAYYLPRIDDGVNHEERLYRVLDQLQPGWRRELVYKRFLPHMAASFGTPLATLNGNSGLASPRLPNHSSIYVAGDYVGSGAQLVDLAVGSALQAVDDLYRRQNRFMTTESTMLNKIQVTTGK